MFKLVDILECGVLQNTNSKGKWFTKKGYFYFIVRSASKNSTFCSDNEDMAKFWCQEIGHAKAFNEWYESLKDNRYDETINNKFPDLIARYDFIIDAIIGGNLPECDLDQYNTSMNIKVEKFADQMAKSFAEN